MLHEYKLSTPSPSLYIQDNIDPIVDEALASFVVGSHQRSHKNAEATETDGSVCSLIPSVYVTHSPFFSYFLLTFLNHVAFHIYINRNGCVE